MSKSTNHQLVLTLTLGLLALCGISAGSGLPAPAQKDNPFMIAQDILKVFYPELFGNQWHLNVSTSQPIDDDRWGEFSGFDFKVARFGPGTSFNPTFDESTGKMATPPQNTTFLEGRTWVGRDGRITQFFVRGDLAHSPQNDAIHKLIESHPEWSDEQDVAALKKAGARYGPNDKQQFVDSLHLDKAEKVLGKLKVVLLEFQTVANPQHDGSFASLFWVVHAEAQLPDGTRGRYVFGFEPFGGKLTDLSFKPNPESTKDL